MRHFIALCGVFLLAAAPARAADAVPATSYFPVLPFDATDEAVPQWVPMAANHAIEGTHPGVTRVIIAVHDDSRDANGAVATMSALAGNANATTLIIAPQFLLPSDIGRFADYLPDHGKAFAAWQINGWAAGDDSAPTQIQKGVSSFTVIDLLLMYLTDRNAFPDLHGVTVAGFGAGGSFVQHYAAFGLAADRLAQQNIDLRYVVAASPSYLYLTATRPLGGRKGFGVPDMAACPAYNAYPYGLDKLNAYGRHVGGNEAKTGYATRFITYVNAAASDAVPASDCAALVQGADSATRAANYKFYLQSLYGDVAARTQTFALARDGKNDAVSLFGSVCGMAALFGDGLCVQKNFGEDR